jgi:hypothetical protein
MKRGAFKGAFDGLERWSQFSYKKQLSEAMDAVRLELDSAVYRYVSRFPIHNYRTLARRLRISPAKLSGILRGFPHGRRPGRRRKPRTAQPNRSVVESPMAVAVSHRLDREGVEYALDALYFCVVNGKADDEGEDSYHNLVHWLKGQKGSKALRDRASYLVQRYESLREKFLGAVKDEPKRQGTLK